MKLNQLVQSKFNVRKEYPPELITDLAESIQVDGLLSKLILSDNGDGTFGVLAGWRRRCALTHLAGSAFDEAILLDDQYIIKKVTDFEALRLSISENVHRLNLSTMELAGAAESLKESNPSLKHKDIAKLLWTTEARAKRLLRLNEHIDELPAQALLELSTPDELAPCFSDAHVEEMSKAGAFSMGSDVIRDVCDMIISNEIPASKVAATVERFIKKDEDEEDEGKEEDRVPEDPTMDGKFNGRLKFEGDQLMIVGKNETVPVDFAYYEEYIRSEDQFTVFVNAKINIKTKADGQPL